MKREKRRTLGWRDLQTLSSKAWAASGLQREIVPCGGEGKESAPRADGALRPANGVAGNLGNRKRTSWSLWVATSPNDTTNTPTASRPRPRQRVNCTWERANRGGISSCSPLIRLTRRNHFAIRLMHLRCFDLALTWTVWTRTSGRSTQNGRLNRQRSALLSAITLRGALSVPPFPRRHRAGGGKRDHGPTSSVG